MKITGYPLVRLPLAGAAAFFSLVAAKALYDNANPPAHCVPPIPYDSWLEQCSRLTASNNREIVAASIIIFTALVAFVLAPRFAPFVYRYLFNRTAGLLIATGFFLFNAVEDAGRRGHSQTLVLIYGVLAAIAFAGVVFARREPPKP